MPRIAIAAFILLVSTLTAHGQGGVYANAKDFLFFADAIQGGGWRVQVAVTNNSPTQVLVGTYAMALDRSAAAVRLDSPEGDELLRDNRFTLAPGATKLIETPSDGPMVRGGFIVLQLSDFAPFETDAQYIGAVLTYIHDGSGQQVSVPPLSESDVAPPFFNEEAAYAAFVEETFGIGTGLALWKTPHNEVCMVLFDLDGALFENPEGHTQICYAPEYGDDFTHRASWLPQWFPGWDFSDGFQGRLLIYVKDNTFGFSGNDGFAVPMALRIRKDSGSMSAMPVEPVAHRQR